MNILFENQADAKRISQYSYGVILSLGAVSQVPEVMITSTQRTPAEQAHAMFVNCSNLGAESQLKLYGEFGDQVVQVYAGEHAKGSTLDQIVAAMTAKIVEIGPGKVSHHCADPTTRNVIDISAIHIPLALRPNFHIAIRKEPRIDRFYDPFTDPKDPAFHLEIPQPGPGLVP